MMLTDDQLTDLATLHLAAKDDGDTWDMLPLLRAVAHAQEAAERARCVKLCDDVTVKMNAECPRAVNGWWPDQVGYACIQAIQGPNAALRGSGTMKHQETR